ncbi:MAG: type II toxin-antitoxin system RelE/ParE family toxin [Polaromonas sp.]|nr:type II toxin-antitoxin system RelE/ParE family toxin [Polaromonas sp.]
MKLIQWSAHATQDIGRLHQFLAVLNPGAAAKVVRSVTQAPTSLQAMPRIGKRIEEFDPREVRRLIVGNYEIRYEVTEAAIIVLRLWRTREDR